MFLVTRVQKRYDMDPETDEIAETIQGRDAHAVEDVTLLLEQVQRGDHRVVGTRVFEFNIDNDGTPTIGNELT